MGFDVTYHPIDKQQMLQWYFEAMHKVDTDEWKPLQKKLKKQGLNMFYTRKYIRTLTAAQKVKQNELFDKTHGFYIAVVQGFFAKYYYIRGAAFSFLLGENKAYRRYTQTWQQLLGEFAQNPAKNHIFENYCSGVFLPPEGVCSLLADYENDAAVRHDIETLFSYGRTELFLAALQGAAAQNLGLLEASEVIEPNADSPLFSLGYTDLNNCDGAGLQLYYDAVAKQVEELIN